MDQAAIDEWNGLLSLIETVRPNADHPDAQAFLDMMQKHAKEQAAFMAQKKAEAEANAKALLP